MVLSVTYLVLVSFSACHRLVFSGKTEQQLSNWFHRIGLWVYLWGIILTSDRYRRAQPTIGRANIELYKMADCVSHVQHVRKKWSCLLLHLLLFDFMSWLYSMIDWLGRASQPSPSLSSWFCSWCFDTVTEA